MCVGNFKMRVGGRGSFTGGIVFYIGLRREACYTVRGRECVHADKDF